MTKLIYGGRFYLNSTFDNCATAILSENGFISHIFYEGEALPQNIESIDLEGGFAYPGFIDTHTHSFEGGLYANGVDLFECKNIAEVLDKIRAALPLLGDETTLFCWRLDESRLKEKRFPTIKEIDELSRDKHIIIRRIDGHSCLLSSNARNLVPALRNYPDEVLNGFANDRAMHWFHDNIGEETVYKAYQKAAQIAIKGGFTTIHTMIGDAKDSISHYSFMAARLSEFPIEYIIYPQTFNIKAALDAGATRIGGCILADGSIGSYTAALSEAYIERPGECGNLYHDDAFWLGFITEAHRNNLQVGVHCLGDRAIEQINNCYLKLALEDKKDLRHQLIHCEITPDDLISKIKASGAIPVMQPAFDRYWGGENGFYASKLGKARTRIMNRFKTLLENKITITGGSDWYITELDAIKGIEAAINHHNPDEQLSPMQAIDIYTKNAAWLSHDENRLGSISIGAQTDLTVVNKALTVQNNFTDTKPTFVIKRGNPVYEP